MKRNIHIILTLGIIWIMSFIICENVNAKTSFKKTQPVGIMSTSVKDSIVVTWESVKDADGYELFEKNSDKDGNGYTLIKTVADTKVIIKERTPGSVYSYYIKAYRTKASGKKIYTKKSAKVSSTVPETGYSTIKNFLKVAIAPVGSTMYVWGGGWNKADTAAGKEAKKVGVSSSWRAFASNKKSGYNYNNYRYQIHNGLDCSGYVGWCIYNVRNTKNNKKGYVMSASKQAKTFANYGWGTYKASKDVTDYKPGDIMSSSGHVWIAVGQCNDGSVVLLHASPPGVQLSGTADPSGKKNSRAYKLAKKYMKKYYGKWYNKYPDVGRGSSYLNDYGQMRWNVSSENVMLSDPEGYYNMSVEEVLKDLFK